MASEAVNILLNLIDNASKGIDNATTKVDNLADKAGKLSAAFAPVSLAAGAALGATIKFAADYDKSIQGAVRGLDLQGNQIQEFKEEISKLGKELKYQLSGSEIANIATEAGKLGIARNKVGDFTKTIVEMATATDKMGSIDRLSANAAKITSVFNMSTEELRKYLAAVNKLDDVSSATSDEILNFTKRLAGVGKSSRLSAQDLSAWGATMIQSGQAPEVAATFMNKFLMVLGAATTLSEPAQRSIEELGWSAKELAVAFDKDANGTMQEFIKRVQKLDRVSQRDILGRVFGQVHVDSAMLLMGVTDDLAKSIKHAGDNVGNLTKLQDEFNKKTQSFEGLSNTFKNQINEIGVQLGTILLPGLIKVMSALSPFIESVLKLTQTNPEMSKWIVTALGIVALISPVLALTSLLIKLTGIVFTVGKAFIFATGVILSAPALAIAGWVALTAAIAATAYAVYKNWGGITEWFGKIFKWLGDGWNYFRNSAANAIDYVVNIVKNWLSNLVNSGYNSGRGLIDGFIKGVFSMSGWAQQNLSKFMSWLGQFFPHSDAKKGEFSRLTESGMSLGETFLNGLNKSNLASGLNNAFKIPTPALTSAYSGNKAGGSTINFSPVYNIQSSSNDELIRQLKNRDRELLDLINKSGNRINRNAY
jgi:TP901 family phage tail tape measure protein